MIKTISNTKYTEELKQLVFGCSTGICFESLLNDCVDYFANLQTDSARLRTKKNNVAKLENMEKLNNAGTSKALKRRLQHARLRLSEELKQREDKIVTRQKRAISFFTKLITFSESSNWKKTQNLSAKLLGTLTLHTQSTLSNRDKRLALIPPIYRTILTLRLVDKLISEETLADEFIKNIWQQDKRYFLEGKLSPVQQTIITPIGLVALFMETLVEVQNPIPDENADQDSDEKEANKFKLTRYQVYDYLCNGLGMNKLNESLLVSTGQPSELHDKFLPFLKRVTNTGPNSSFGFISTPLIYTQLLFSKGVDSKNDPTISVKMLKKLVDAGKISKEVFKLFVEIVGIFPQGTGISFIPKDENGYSQNKYEYAIVNGLNPKSVFNPQCRVTTRSLKYISNGKDLTIREDENLYFKNTRKKTARLSEDKLRILLQGLYHDFDKDRVEELLPRFWNPNEYFSFKKNQNLWTKFR